MDEYRDPTLQGSTAEDFLRPNQSFPVYQYSVFVNGDRNEQLVVRASTFEELLAGKRNIQLALKGENTHYEANHSHSSSSNVNGHNNGYSNGQVECDLHEAEIFTVKKDGPNKGKQFKSCVKCRKFLGFV